ATRPVRAMDKFSLRTILALGVFSGALPANALAADAAKHYLWLEADEFRDIQLNLQVAHGGGTTAEQQTNWASRMAIFPDTTQGGPTRILSLDAHAKRAKNSCWRNVYVPAAGKYR